MRNTSGLRRDGSPGHKGAGGRPPDWLKSKCAKIVEDKKLIEFLGDVAGGEPFVEKTAMVDSGKVFEKIVVSADLKDRIKAVEILIERAWGRAPQAVEVGGKDGGPIQLQPVIVDLSDLTAADLKKLAGMNV